MIRFLLVLVMLAGTAGAVVAYGDPDQIARASNKVSHIFRTQTVTPAPAVQIQRGQGGEFALRAKINGVAAPMVIDTGATSVVLTWETAKAIGLPLEMLEYDVDLETAGGHTKAARLTLDRLAVGHLVEKSVPALVVQRGQMKTNLLGMSFLDRLESWGVRADKLMLTGYPELQGSPRRARMAVDQSAGIATMDSRLLFFGTAGLAAGEFKDGPINKMKMGWTAGGGVEWAFLPKWSAKAEQLYTEFKHDDLPDWNAAKFHTFRVGVNYHFDLFR